VTPRKVRSSSVRIKLVEDCDFVQAEIPRCLCLLLNNYIPHSCTSPVSVRTPARMAAIGNVTSDAGVFTAEGNAAGAFAAVLASQRQKDHAEFERKKAELASVASKKSITELGDKFATSSSVLTAGAGEHYGLSRLGETKPALPAAPVDAPVATAAAPPANAVKRRRGVLSFTSELDEDDRAPATAVRQNSASGAPAAVPASAASSAASASATALLPPSSARLCKDPGVDTTFLPDKDREARESLLREQLKQEFLQVREPWGVELRLRTAHRCGCLRVPGALDSSGGITRLCVFNEH
jgi:hypothetical protein